MEGIYRLAQQRPAPHYAFVRVIVEARTQRTSYVSPNVFSWLRDVYGEGAKEGPYLEVYKQEALEGSDLALSLAGVGGEVTIAEIRYNNVDTVYGDVRYAAAHAVWEALSHTPDETPWIDESGVHFLQLPIVGWQDYEAQSLRLANYFARQDGGRAAEWTDGETAAMAWLACIRAGPSASAGLRRCEELVGGGSEYTGSGWIELRYAYASWRRQTGSTEP